MSQDTIRADTLRTPLGRVRGLGSARGGTHHWWAQRVTSVALLPLTIWFALSAASMAGADHAQAAAWIGRPWNAVLLLGTIGLSFHHTAAGLQVVMEDYLKPEWKKVAGIYAVRAGCWLLALACALAVARLAIVGVSA